MEPIVTPLHSSCPPPLDDDGDGEAGSEEDEFGDFGGFSVGVSCSPLSFADSTKPPSSLRRPSSPAAKPATLRPSCSFNHPVEQSQPASTVHSGPGAGQIDVEGQDCNAESCAHLTNGYADGHHTSWAQNASIEGTSSPKEETGFADFTVFTEQAAHPWCCGFSPLGSTEQWAVGVEGAVFGGQICAPGHEVVKDSEPRSHCAYKAKENFCTKFKHCEKRDTALSRPPQDPHQPQEATAALGVPPEQPRLGEEDTGKRGDRWRKRRQSLNSLETSEVQEDGESEKDDEKSVSTVPQTLSVYESASEDLASICDDLSFEGASADLEPNVSSLSSKEDQTDWDQTDDENEELGGYRHSDPFVSSSVANLSLSEESATQETSATSNRSHSITCKQEGFADSADGSFEHYGDEECVQTADVRVLSLGSLPPSDSFADFCAAPTQEEGDGWWEEFQDQRAQEGGKTWTQFRVSSLQTDLDTDEEKEKGSLSIRVQQLIWASFPEVVVPALDGEEEEAQSLGALIHTGHLPEGDEEKTAEPGGVQWVQRGLWWPLQDVHSAVGLRFQWGGSHANRILLRCLGMDTRNIVFIGPKKQAVAVPAFASSLGMLEPIKDSVPAVGSPGHTAVTAQAPPGPQDPSRHPVQEALPSSPLDWSRRGLSSSQDGCSAFNLECFGPGEESRSSSSSSCCSHSPPPGVDRELYEPTISKLETSAANCRHHLEDALSRLMSSAGRTSTLVRKPQQDEELSAEAGRVIARLPNLCFMKDKVLMFPSVLLPKECSSPVLE